jgi:hypothetical protein
VTTNPTELETTHEGGVDFHSGPAVDAPVFLTVVWAARADSPDQTAIPLAATFAALAKASPQLAGRWQPAGDPDGVFPSTAEEWRSSLERPISYVAGRAGTTDVVTVRLFAGNDPGAPHQSGNRLIVGIASTQAGGTVDLTGLEEAFRQVITSLVAIWRPDWASISTRDTYQRQAEGAGEGLPVIGALTWISDAVSDLPRVGDVRDTPRVVAGAEVVQYRRGKLMAIPSFMKPTNDTAAILAVRNALVAAAAIRPLPAHQASTPIADPAEFEVAASAYVEFRGRSVIEHPERVSELFPGDDGDRLIAEIREARDLMDSVWVSEWAPTSAEMQAEARAKISALVPGLTPAALDLLLEWWVYYSLW